MKRMEWDDILSSRTSTRWRRIKKMGWDLKKKDQVHVRAGEDEMSRLLTSSNS